MKWLRLIVLAIGLYTLLISPAYSLTEPIPLSYPPLTSAPSDMVVDKYGYIWVALPSEKSVCRIDIASNSIRIINLPTAATKVLKTGDKIVAYQRGSEKIFIIDPSSLKVASSLELQKPLENAWPSSHGFWVMLAGAYGLFQIGEDGSIIKEYKLEVMDSEQSLSEYGKAVWYINSDGKSISRLDTSTGAAQSINLEKFVYAILAATENEAWVITSDETISLVSINSATPLKTLKPNSGIVGISKMYLIDRDRIVFVNAASGVVGEIDGEVINEQSLGGDLPTLTDMFKTSKLYYIDVKKSSLGFMVISNPPEIVDYSLKIRSEYELVVEATIKDREADFKDGYPRVRVMQGDNELFKITMTPITIDKFSGSIMVNNINGKISIIIEAMDWGDNLVRTNVGTLNVNNGRIVTTTTTVQSTTTTNILTQTSTVGTDIGQIMIISLELVMLISLVAALLVIMWRKPSRTRRARRSR